MNRFVVMALSIAAGWMVSQSAAAVTLVSDGEPAAVIVLGAQPHPVAFEAAVELQRVIRRMSGAKLPIYLENEFSRGHEGPSRFTPRIFVGDSQTAREAGLDLSDVAPEGFKIITTAFSPTRGSPVTHPRPPKNTYPAIILAGRDDEAQNWGWKANRAVRYTRGTAYAVYNFLEQDLGVRWLWPGELGEAAPSMKTITVNPKNRSDAPKLPKRIVRNGYDYSVPAAWNARTELGGNFGVFTRLAEEADMWFDHIGLGDSLPKYSVATEGHTDWPEKFGKDHPEWFAMQSDGTRLLKYPGNRVRLCLANPEVIDQIVKEADAFFREHPDKIMYGIELADVWGSYCVDDLCKAWGPTQSDIVARHWAAIGERIEKMHPDKLLYAHPYHTYIDPPTNVDRLPDNIILFPVGQNVHGYTAEPDRRRSIESWLGWAKLNRAKMIWRPNYPHNDVGYPLNYARRIAADIKLFYENKLMGTDIDSLRRFWAGSGLNYYVVCKLLWDPTRDVDAMIGDYCEKGFGAAASEIEAYFDFVEKLTTDIAGKEVAGFHPMGLPGGTTGSFGLAVHFTPEVTKAMHALLDEAVVAAGDDEIVKQRIAFLRKSVEYVEVERRVVLAGQRANNQELSQEEIEQTRALLEERRAFISRAAGKNYLNAESTLHGADWIERILEEEEERLAGKDDFSDLWLANDFVVDLPEDWKFKTDPKRVGLSEKWYARDHNDAEWQTVKIGEFWDVQGHRDYDGIGWYRRRITLPATLAGKRILFAFGAADETALVYIDGERAAEYDVGPMGWDKRFVLDLTDHVKPGVEQVHAIRVIDTAGAGGLWKPIKVMTPKVAGRTQTLHLEPAADAYVRRNFEDIAYGKSPTLAVGSNDWFRLLMVWELPEALRAAQVRSAKIVLVLRYASKPSTYVMHPFPADWHERTVTWSRRSAEQEWPQGEAAPTEPAISRLTIDRKVTSQDTEDADTPITVEFDVSEYLRQRGGGMERLEVIIIQETLDPEANFSPHSREAENPRHRPQLVIEYELTSR